ncbi:MAG: SH3 domain-containing protein [Roseovarius sp.]|uniref:SH3 domain-containing protein n=1 Tax=Roseovarius sp. TaxID=1486281 RepID=UPI0032EFD421
MRRIMVGAVTLAVLAGCNTQPTPMLIGMTGRAEVAGVEAGDMLKLRAGPGLGYEVIVGLPNGTLMRTGACNRVGGTVWCEAALDRDPGTKGYVSETYLRKL